MTRPAPISLAGRSVGLSMPQDPEGYDMKCPKMGGSGKKIAVYADKITDADVQW